MIISGQQKLTLIDFPGHLATTIFTAGCNFRCPFCHNPELVLGGRVQVAADDSSERDFFAFLEKRRGKIEGVCITGGEPTLQPDLIDFIRKIKERGFMVKLDTNGTRPDVVKKLIDQRLLDFVAMDIKNRLEKYGKTAGTKLDPERIELSVDLIRNNLADYEFRTTVVPGLHEEEDFLAIARWLSGSRAYYLQEYREDVILDNNLKKITAGKQLDLSRIKRLIEKDFGHVGIRS